MSTATLLGTSTKYCALNCRGWGNFRGRTDDKFVRRRSCPEANLMSESHLPLPPISNVETVVKEGVIRERHYGVYNEPVSDVVPCGSGVDCVREEGQVRPREEKPSYIR